MNQKFIHILRQLFLGRIQNITEYEEIVQEYHVVFREDGSHYYENDEGDIIDLNRGRDQIE